MTATATPTRRGANEAARPSRDSITINLRVPRKTRDLIDSAASVLGKSRTEFMIETARKHAVDVLLDQRLFELEPAQFEAFNRALDEPAEPSKSLKDLLKRKPQWEK